MQVLRPGTLVAASSPWIGRSNLLARRLDELFGSLTFADVERRPRYPQLFIRASDMSLGTRTEFTWDPFALIGSGPRSVPLPFALAAPSAVPLRLGATMPRNDADCCAVERERADDARVLRTAPRRQGFGPA